MTEELEPFDVTTHGSVRKSGDYEAICRDHGKANKNCPWNISHLFLTSLVFITGICFLALNFRFNDFCSRRIFVETSILNKGDIIEPELDPCDDFYSFACGRWNYSSSSNYNIISVVEETEIRNLLRLECFLKQPPSKMSKPWTRFVKETYYLCERERRASIRESATVDFVKNWAAPFLQGGRNQTVDDTLRRVHHKFLQNGLFSWDVTLDLKGDRIIQAVRIAPPKKSWNDVSFDSKTRLAEYMKEILFLLGVENESIQSKCEDIADFYLQLQFRANKTISKSAPLTRKRATYEEFVNAFDFIDFDEYFKEFRLIKSVPVVVEGEDYFKWLSDYLKNIEKEKPGTVQNFLYWCFVDFFVPYMPKAFVQVRNRCSNKLGPKAELGHVCVNAVKKGMNFAVTSFFMDNVLDDKSRDMINDIVLHVKNSFRDFLHSLQKSSPGNRKWLNGLEGVFENIEIGIPSHLRDIYENNLPFDAVGGSFPSYYVSAITFIKTRMLSYINTVPLAVLFVPDFLQLNGIFISLPLLLINMGILTPPLFHPRQPLSLNYAGLGFVLSHELAHSIDYLATDATSIRNDLKTKLECLHKQYSESKRISDVIREDFADNAGIKIAYKAYLEHISRHHSIKETTLNERKMFFVHFGQILCEDGSSFSLERNAYHSPYKHRVNIPLSNFPDFSDTFSCPKGSKMNNENKCLI